MKTVSFSEQGGIIKAEAQCQPNRDGSYSITLWKAHENAFVKRWRGNFINTADDVVELPGNNAEHDGRIVELLATVAMPPGIGPSDVVLIITQNDHELGRDSMSIPPNSPAGMADVFVQLVAQP